MARRVGQKTPTRASFTPTLVGTGPTVTVTSSTFYGVPLQVQTAVGVLGVGLFQYSTDGGQSFTVGLTTGANVSLPTLPGVQLHFSAGTYAINTLNGVV